MKHKKLLIGVAVVVVVLVVAAIGNYWDSQKPAPAASSQPPAASDPAPAENPLIAADFKTADVMNGLNTEKIGEYGYIEMQKADMEAVTADQLTEFCKSKVDGSGLYRVMILFEDGTGLHINSGSWLASIPYGPVDPLTNLLSDNTGAVMASSWSADGSTPASYEYISFEELHEIQDAVESAIDSKYSGFYSCVVDFAEDSPGYSVTVLTDDAGNIETLEALIRSLDNPRIAEISITAMQDGKVIATN